jgi:predicted DNA binding CopG/RHH family protein
MSTKKTKWLENYASESNYEIDYELTNELKDALSDTHINIRVPTQLKNELVAMAKKKNIPYQRLIKSVLIEAIGRNKPES